MSKPKVKVSRSPLDASLQRPVSRETYCFARLDMKKSWIGRKEKGTLYVPEDFLKYLKESILSEEEQRIILESLVSQQTEKYDMVTNKNNPFYGQEAAFEQYCKVKYKKLYYHIDRMLKRIFPD